MKFWNDIEALLEKHSDVARRFYPDQFAPESALVESIDGNLEIAMGVQDWRERLELFLTHTTFVAIAGGQLHSLRMIASELIDNALNRGKGGASRVTVDLIDRKLSIRDDGQSFDSIDSQIELQPEMQGIRAIRQHVKSAGNELTYRYLPKDPVRTRFNLVDVEIFATRVQPNNPCRASGPAHQLLDRIRAVEFVDNLAIPTSCEDFTLRFQGDAFVNCSAGSELIERLRRRLKGRKLRILIDSGASHLFDTLVLLAGDQPDVSIIQD